MDKKRKHDQLSPSAPDTVISSLPQSTFDNKIIKCLKKIAGDEKLSKQGVAEYNQRLTAAINTYRPSFSESAAASTTSSTTATTTATSSSARKEETPKAVYFKTLQEAYEAAVGLMDDHTLSEITFDADGTFLEEKKGENFRSLLVSNKPEKYFRFYATNEEKRCICIFKTSLENTPKAEFLRNIRDTFDTGAVGDVVSDKYGAEILRGYVENLMDTEPGDLARYKTFSSDPSKAAAVVVSGESGSGKSALVSNELGRLAGAANMYHSLDESIHQLWVEPKEKEHTCKVLESTFQSVFLHLENHGQMGGVLYNSVSKLHYMANQWRNERAVSVLETIFEAKCNTHAKLKSWWSGKEPPVDKLVVVIDEAGKHLDFARGLIDSVRVLYAAWRKKKRCVDFKLIISGSGLEASIKSDSLGFDGPSDLAAEIASFGTDPMKSSVVVVRGPSKKYLETNLQQYFQNLGTADDFHTYMAAAIQRGIYSKVLATNSRMLFDGVIPAMEITKLTDGIKMCNLEQRFVDLGSTNVVMDFAARAYFDLNGLKDVPYDGRKKMLAQSFLFILKTHYLEVKGKNPSLDGEVDASKMALKDEDERRLKDMGLVASKPADTSPALRYLACEGDAAELIPSDGISFEAVLAAHLKRYEQVVNRYQVEVYNLQEAWPPRSSKNLGEIVDDAIGKNVDDEIKTRFSTHSFVDVGKICERLTNNYKLKPTNVPSNVPSVAPSPGKKNKKNKKKKKEKKKKIAIVMRQQAPTAQGADVIVLKAARSSNSLALVLDLYQAKHYGSVCGTNTKTFNKWARSLGINLIDKKLNGSALYSNKGVNFLAASLRSYMEQKHPTLTVTVSIGKRVMVVSCPLSETNWSSEDLKFVCESGIVVWTKENLEPTISAIGWDNAEVMTTIDSEPLDWGGKLILESFLEDGNNSC